LFYHAVLVLYFSLFSHHPSSSPSFSPSFLYFLLFIDWLDDEPRTYHDLPGRWWSAGEAAYVEADGEADGAEQPVAEVVETIAE